MAIEYEIQVQGDLLYVVASGFDENLEEVQAYGQAVIDACLEHQCRRILTDERRLRYELSTLETYELVKYYEKHTSMVVRVAIVCHPEYFEDAYFWETASQNRGLFFRAFSEMEKAREWLGLL